MIKIILRENIIYKLHIVALFVGKLLGWQIDGHFYSTIISAFSEIQNVHRQDTITGNRNINTETIHGTTSSVCGAQHG